MVLFVGNVKGWKNPKAGNSELLQRLSCLSIVDISVILSFVEGRVKFNLKVTHYISFHKQHFHSL